ncbi:Huntingtin interacting protein E-like protein [plant metagenome]|uniref:Huntingtin interacting protein E-like protein n=1 Tax=plant metagenome TaxID=1297885 RepID=A0A484RUL1_9ZZZZ
MSSSELAAQVDASWSTVKRQLDALLKGGEILREGQARATRYRIDSSGAAAGTAGQTEPDPIPGTDWSKEGRELLARLQQPLATREPVGYQRDFVDDYVPNASSLLPQALANALFAEGRMQGQQPAGTYARNVLGPLLIDLSWSSSRLEGNRYSLLATQELFQRGTSAGDLDAVMLLNHKAAIEFLVDAVPEYGLASAVIRNLHAILMQDLLADAQGLGNIRRKVVNISDTTYVPAQAPSLLEEMFEHIIEKARQVKNPVEAAFFLWVNLAYLQPFEDGNKRTSRLSANIPLMLYNCAPLSFLDVEVQDYAYAMMGVYEHRDVTLAAELFGRAYRRSIKKYAVQLDAMGVPDPTRLRFREGLNEAIGRVVREGQTIDEAVAGLALSAEDRQAFAPMLVQELQALDLHNCARYRLTLGQTRRWIEAGRPQ